MGDIRLSIRGLLNGLVLDPEYGPAEVVKKIINDRLPGVKPPYLEEKVSFIVNGVMVNDANPHFKLVLLWLMHTDPPLKARFPDPYPEDEARFPRKFDIRTGRVTVLLQRKGLGVDLFDLEIKKDDLRTFLVGKGYPLPKPDLSEPPGWLHLANGLPSPLENEGWFHGERESQPPTSLEIPDRSHWFHDEVNQVKRSTRKKVVDHKGDPSEKELNNGGRPPKPYSEAVERAFMFFWKRGETAVLERGKASEFAKSLMDLRRKESSDDIEVKKTASYINERIKEIKTIHLHHHIVTHDREIIKSNGRTENIKSKTYTPKNLSNELSKLRKKNNL